MNKKIGARIDPAGLRVGDELVAGFPDTALPSELPGVLGSGWWVVEADHLDDPAAAVEQPTGRELTAADVAQRVGLVVTHVVVAQNTVLVVLELPGVAAEYVRRLNRHADVYTIRRGAGNEAS
jgi:hypothetical protein